MNRRNLLLATALSAPALLMTRAVIASEPALLSPDDPIAIALKYVEDASTVPAEKKLRPSPAGAQQNCANCALYQAVREDAGRCSAVPGKLVKASGWCSAWAPTG